MLNPHYLKQMAELELQIANERQKIKNEHLQPWRTPTVPSPPTAKPIIPPPTAKPTAQPTKSTFGDDCNQHQDCESGFCKELKKCDYKQPDGTPCDEDAQCVNGYCKSNPEYGDNYKECSKRKPTGARCTSETADSCMSGICKYYGWHQVMEESWKCATGNGFPCSNDSECGSNFCKNGQQCAPTECNEDLNYNKKNKVSQQCGQYHWCNHNTQRCDKLVQWYGECSADEVQTQCVDYSICREVWTTNCLHDNLAGCRNHIGTGIYKCMQ